MWGGGRKRSKNAPHVASCKCQACCLKREKIRLNQVSSQPWVERHYGLKAEIVPGTSGYVFEKRRVEPDNHIAHYLNDASPEVAAERVLQLTNALQSTQTEMVEQKRKFDAAINYKNQQIDQLSTTINKKNADLQAASEHNSALTNKLRDAKRDLQLNDELAVRVATTNNKLKQDLQDMKKIEQECNVLKAKLDDTGKQLQFAQESHQDCHLVVAKAKELSEQLSQSHRVSSSYASDLEQYKTDMQRSARAHQLALMDVARLQQQLRGVNNERLTLISDINKMTSMMRALKGDQQSVVDEMMDLKEDLKAARRETSEAQRQLEDTLEELSDLRRVHRKCSTVSDELIQMTRDFHASEGVTRSLQKLASLKCYLGVLCIEGSEEGTQLSEVKAGYAGYQCGLRTGDIVTQINGKWTPSKANFFQAMVGVRPGEPMVFKVIKQGRDLVLRTLIVRMGAVGITLEELLALRKNAGLVDQHSLSGLTGMEELYPKMPSGIDTGDESSSKEQQGQYQDNILM